MAEKLTNFLKMLKEYSDTFTFNDILHGICVYSVEGRNFMENYLGNSLSVNAGREFTRFIINRKHRENGPQGLRNKNVGMDQDVLNEFFAYDIELNEIDLLYFLKEKQTTKIKFETVLSEFLDDYMEIDMDKIIKCLFVKLDESSNLCRHIVQIKADNILDKYNYFFNQASAKYQILTKQMVNSNRITKDDILNRQKTFITPEIFASVLKEYVIGQDKICDAISTDLIDVLNDFNLVDDKSGLPLAVIMFAGASGTGKSLLAKTIGKEAFSSNNCLELSCEEYQDSTSVNKLFGSNPGYVGFGVETELVKFLNDLQKSGQKGVLILNEIEKMHHDAQQSLLSALDGKPIKVYTKNKQSDFHRPEEVLTTLDLSNVFVVATSNLANEELEKGINKLGFSDTKEGEISDVELVKMAGIKSGMSKEFLNRFTEIYVFNNLSQNDLLQIAKQKTNQLLQNIKNKCIELDIKIDESANQFLVSQAIVAKNTRVIENLCRKKIANVINIATLTTPDPLLYEFVVSENNNNIVVISNKKQQKEEKIIEQNISISR